LSDSKKGSINLGEEGKVERDYPKMAKNSDVFVPLNKASVRFQGISENGVEDCWSGKEKALIQQDMQEGTGISCLLFLRIAARGICQEIIEARKSSCPSKP